MQSPLLRNTHYSCVLNGPGDYLPYDIGFDALVNATKPEAAPTVLFLFLGGITTEHTQGMGCKCLHGESSYLEVEMSKQAARLIIKESASNKVLLIATENLWGFPQLILDSGSNVLEQIVQWLKKEMPQVHTALIPPLWILTDCSYQVM